MVDSDPVGAIAAGNIYLASELRRRLRLGGWAWRKMRRAGLKVIRQGRQDYVLSDDVLAYFRELSRSSAVKDR